MSLKLLQVVRLVRDVPEAGLAAGTAGTIVDLLREDGTAYEVEVVDDNGRTVFLGPLAAGDVTAALVVDEAEARTRVEAHIAGKGDDPHDPWTPVVTRVEPFARGWVIFYGAAEDDVLLAGNAPLLVDAATGELVETGTAHPVEHYVENYLRTGSPHG